MTFLISCVSFLLPIWLYFLLYSKLVANCHFFASNWHKNMSLTSGISIVYADENIRAIQLQYIAHLLHVYSEHFPKYPVVVTTMDDLFLHRLAYCLLGQIIVSWMYTVRRAPCHNRTMFACRANNARLFANP